MPLIRLLLETAISPVATEWSLVRTHMFGVETGMLRKLDVSQSGAPPLHLVHAIKSNED
jgi:hypothetical protein